MKIYYWENPTSSGSFKAESDEVAIAKSKKIPAIMVCYRESDNASGLPFVIVYEPTYAIRTSN